MEIKELEIVERKKELTVTIKLVEARPRLTKCKLLLRVKAEAVTTFLLSPVAGSDVLDVRLVLLHPGDIISEG